VPSSETLNTSPVGIPVHSGVSAFANAYDVFILDLWGVLHDGLTAYDGACDTLERLKVAGKTIILLSNAPRRVEALVANMEDMGIPRSCYDGIMSSGEAVHYLLRDKIADVYAGLGRRVFLIGLECRDDLLEGLDYQKVDAPEDADFILVTGPSDFNHDISHYIPIIDRCAVTRPVMICANPDRAVIRDGRNVVCAGNIADLYTERGGQVHEMGKPDPFVYDLALRLAHVTDRSRVVGVGDSFATDMTGCYQAGIAGVFCARGVHAKALGVANGQMPKAADVSKLAQSYGLAPIAAIPAFVWE